MVNSFSTSSVHRRDGISYWVEVATRAFCKHEFRSRVGRSFEGELRAAPVGQLRASRCIHEPCDVERTQRHIARDDVDDITLSVRLSGTSLHAQDDQSAAHRPGTMVLLDASRPFKISLRSPTDSVVVMVPREPLVARLGDLGMLTAQPISTDGAIAGLASAFLFMLVERAGALDEAAGPKLSEQALDLVALAFSQAICPNGLTLSSPRAATLLRVKAAIEARLFDPTLKPTAVAAAVGISVRYANDLLSQEGSSVERYILNRRLERCRQALEDEAQAHRMIGDIAFSWGFSDLSHFSRRFRAAYGMTSGEYRRRAKLSGGEPSGRRGVAHRAQRDDKHI